MNEQVTSGIALLLLLTILESGNSSGLYRVNDMSQQQLFDLDLLVARVNKSGVHKIEVLDRKQGPWWNRRTRVLLKVS